MSMLWLAPPLILLFGLGLVLRLLSSIERERQAIHHELHRVDHVRGALQVLRVEADRARTSFDRLPER